MLYNMTILGVIYHLKYSCASRSDPGVLFQRSKWWKTVRPLHLLPFFSQVLIWRPFWICLFTWGHFYGCAHFHCCTIVVMLVPPVKRFVMTMVSITNNHNTFESCDLDWHLGRITCMKWRSWRHKTFKHEGKFTAIFNISRWLD